jgi:antitoxin component of RelBE/YafQ-DinJ toxin-antitoxin module
MNDNTSNESETIEKLQNVIKQMMAPIKDIPLKIVLEAISGNKVIPFETENKLHQNLLEKLKEAAQLACHNINTAGGIISGRVNEVGNKVELPIKEALRQVGFNDADVPVNKKGIKQSSGYPDLGFTFGDLYVYIECKTYNKKTVGTTQRSFYLSPTEGFKVTKDAIHIVISLEIDWKENISVQGQNFGVYLTRAWKVVQIENIDVDVKREFNSDNKRMYAKENILAEGAYKI